MHDSFGIGTLFLGPFVLEPNLDTTDIESGLFGQILSHESGRSGGLGKNVLKHLGLGFGKFCPGSAFFGILRLVLGFLLRLVGFSVILFGNGFHGFNLADLSMF